MIRGRLQTLRSLVSTRRVSLIYLMSSTCCYAPRILMWIKSSMLQMSGYVTSPCLGCAAAFLG